MAGDEGSVCRRGQRFQAETLPFRTALVRFALRLTGCSPDAEDLVQETYLRAWRSFDRYASGTNLRAWLFAIMQRAHVDSWRHCQLRAPRTVPLDWCDVASPPEQARMESGWEDLQAGLRALAEPMRAVVVLRDVQDLECAEIAARLKIPIGTAMSRIHRGRRRLRAFLERRGAEREYHPNAQGHGAFSGPATRATRPAAAPIGAAS